MMTFVLAAGVFVVALWVAAVLDGASSAVPGSRVVAAGLLPAPVEIGHRLER